MRRFVVIGVLAGLIALPVSPSGARDESEPEACEAVNPGQPKCTYVATHEAESPVTGIAGAGSWIVKIKRGKTTTTFRSPSSGEPTAITFEFIEGDKATATALSPGSGVTVGHAL